MAQTSWPFENIDTTEVQFSQWARHINEGIRPDFASELEVFADDSGLNVKVRSGQAMVRGHYYASTAEETLTITTPDATNPRIDSVVLELDIVANSILQKVVAGTPDASPVAPTLTQSEDGNVYQFLLANVDVAAGVFSIKAGDVTDLRTYMFQGVGKWTTDTRPANPTDNQTIGYNTTLQIHEIYNGTEWVEFGAAVGGAIAYEAPDIGGTFAVDVESGAYNVNAIAGFPITLGSKTINADTRAFILESNATNLEFPDTSTSFSKSATLPININAVEFGDGLFVAVGDDIYTSTDGNNWTLRSTQAANDITFGNGRFVAVRPGVALYSDDGITWNTGTGVANDLQGVTFGNNTFVAVVGDSSTRNPYYSSDGINWTQSSTQIGDRMYTVTFGNSTFVAAGNNGEYAVSTDDGVTWTSNDIFGYYWRGSTFGNNTFAIVASPNRVLTSTDANTWTLRNPANSTGLYAADFANNIFVFGGSQGYLTKSTDTVTYEEISISDVSIQFYDITYGNDTWIAVSETGEIYKSKAFTQYLILEKATIEELS